MNGFTMQQTTFPYICVIIDDASTDGEQEVIRKYLQSYFDLENPLTKQDESDDFVRIFSRHKENMNCYFLVILLKYNHQSIKKAKSPYFLDWIQGVKYVAMCEGDDYWIHPKKLQMQLEFLSRNEDYDLCYTKSKILNTTTNSIEGEIGRPCESFIEMLNGNPIATLNVCYRYEALRHYNKEVRPMERQWMMSDYPQWLYLSANGKLKFFEEVTSVYRKHFGSISRPRDIANKFQFIASTKDIQLFFAKKYLTDNQELEAAVCKIEKQYALSVIFAYKEYGYKGKGLWGIFKSRYLSYNEKMRLIFNLLAQ